MIIDYAECAGHLDRIEQSDVCEFLKSHEDVLRSLDDLEGQRFLINNKRFWVVESVDENSITLASDGFIDGRWKYRVEMDTTYYTQFEVTREEDSWQIA